MKYFVLVLLVTVSSALFGQSNDCFSANPFCSSTQYDFPNATSGTAPSGPNYGCVSSVPAPIWYYMEIGVGGTIGITIGQTTGSGGSGSSLDVDFVMWGPFTSLGSGCNSVMNGVAPIQSSYSEGNVENIGIGMQGGSNSLCFFGVGQTTPPAAVAGQVYIVLITNWDEDPGFITFNQTSGTGSADCSIVDPCSIDNFTATVSACNPATNQYSVSGTVAVSNAPTTGTLVVEACDGTQVVIATAPFGASSYTFSLPGLAANGAPCSIETYFTDGACSQILTYTAPVCPTTPCFFTHIDAHLDPCDAGNFFSLTGSVEFINAPTTGQLIVQDCNGNAATYNPPFVSPLYYQMTANANGQNCGVTATFTADPACQINVDYQNTQPCDCVVDIGTFASSFAGESTTPYVLCYGDELLIESNGDFVPPGIALNPPLAAGYNPNIGWLLFSCPPTVGVVPHLTEDVEDDPCYLGLVMIGDFYDNNDLYFINQNPGTFANNTVYWVPLTFYNTIGSYTYSFVNTDMPCYEMGTPYPVQYLTEITGTFNADCEAGTLSMTVQGGSPEINGTNFTAIVQTPSYATVTTNNVPNGGTLVVSGLQDGDNYSILVQDEFGCPIEFSGVFDGSGSAVITYPQTTYCKNVSNPVPTVTGTAGGVFTGTGDMVINPTTGVIDLNATPAGNYTVTYNLSGSCSTNGTVNVQIFDVPVVVAVGDAVCPNETAVLSATGADSYTWSPSNGLSSTTGATVTATLAGTQTYTVTGINLGSGCSSSAQATVVVDVQPEALFNSTPQVASEFNPQISFINHSQGATSYQWNFGDGATSTAVNPTHIYVDSPDSYVVTLIAISPAGCADTISSVVVIQEELIFYIPNTFTPDQDEFNQIFKPIFTSGYDPYDYTLQIFNRWGELIFESHNTEIGWDGTYGKSGLCQDGTYTWKIEVKTARNDERKMFVGHVNLLR